MTSEKREKDTPMDKQTGERLTNERIAELIADMESARGYISPTSRDALSALRELAGLRREVAELKKALSNERRALGKR